MKHLETYGDWEAVLLQAQKGKTTYFLSRETCSKCFQKIFRQRVEDNGYVVSISTCKCGKLMRIYHGEGIWTTVKVHSYGRAQRSFRKHAERYHMSTEIIDRLEPLIPMIGKPRRTLAILK